MEKAEEDDKKWHPRVYGCLLEDVYANPENEGDKLTTFVQLPGDDYMRGAELWLCPRLRRERWGRRRNLIQAVVAKDIEMKLLGIKSPLKAEETLAILSHNLSASKRIFARRMGHSSDHCPSFPIPPAKEAECQPGHWPSACRFILLGQVAAKMAAAMGA